MPPPQPPVRGVGGCANELGAAGRIAAFWVHGNLVSVGSSSRRYEECLIARWTVGTSWSKSTGLLRHPATFRRWAMLPA